MLLMSTLIILIGCQVLKRLVRPDEVICLVPALQLPIMILQSDLNILHFIKLFTMRPTRSFHIALQLWASRGMMKKQMVCPL
jgi:hypothetical protein